jgi:putative transposase
MPGRNTLKIYIPNTYYHVYNRGLNKGAIFLGPEDYEYFEWLFARCLSAQPVKDKKGREYTWFREGVRLHAYCLMPNHFHMFVYQSSSDRISKMMSTISTAYVLYFNKKYKRRGPLFENTYRAVPVIRDAQLQHITRYIHLNNRSFRTWPYSSYKDYVSAPREWVEPQPILDLFDSKQQYMDFMTDYEDIQRANDDLKREMADYL